MSKLDLAKGLRPGRFVRALRERGARGLATHALRRAGTLAERASVGPETIRINPMGYVCNHTCPMCWLQHLPDGELPKMKKIDRDEGCSSTNTRRSSVRCPRACAR